jgi:negative regulator of sigma E activity
MNETDHAGEELSSLIDGELSNAEFDRAFDSISGDSARRARWTRYHVAVDAMKNSLPRVMAPADFSLNVAKAIESEPAILAPQRRKSPMSTIHKQITGLAVAASVAMVAVLGVKSMQSGDPAAQVAQTPSAPQTAVAVTASDPSMARVASDQRAPIPAQVQSQLNRYLLNHNQNAFAAPGMLPYARIVSHGAGESAE